jgi:hypothetical protein
MRRRFLGRKELSEADQEIGKQLPSISELAYYLIIDDDRKTFGVEIIMKRRGSTGDHENEFESTLNISNDIYEAETIIKMLSDNIVTPLGLRYVLEDMEII